MQSKSNMEYKASNSHCVFPNFTVLLSRISIKLFIPMNRPQKSHEIFCHLGICCTQKCHFWCHRKDNLPARTLHEGLQTEQMGTSVASP